MNNIYTHIFCIQRYIGCYFSVTLLSSIIPTAGKLKSLVYEIAPFFPTSMVTFVTLTCQPFYHF